jgi:ribosomal-protein-alanine N-acetyltransferase
MIETDRLELLPATPSLLRDALNGPEALAHGLGAVVPASWPPEYLDAAAFDFTLTRLSENPTDAGWWMYFVVLRAGAQPRTLIGSGGYKGPADREGTVEVGYGIVADRRLQGYATEAARGLIAHAFAQPEVNRVIAETLPELLGSIAVLGKCGLRFCGEGSEPGVIRFELTRAEFDEPCGETVAVSWSAT